MEDRFALMQVQLESVSAGCPCMDGRCPCACSKGAPVKEPPRRCPATAHKDAWEDGDDPWRGFAKKKAKGSGGTGGGGGHGGDGDDGDDDGDGDGDGDDESHHFDKFDIGIPDGRGHKLAHQYEYGRLFEAKGAKFLP